MGRVGLPELVIILVIVVIIFGANRLPQLGHGIGSAIKNFKNATGGDGDERVSSAQPAACPNCATVNPPDSRFCRGCGQKL